MPGWYRLRRADRHAWGEQGNALVETALVLPLLLTLAFAVVGIAHVTHAQMAVSAVAREAARAGALAATANEALTRGVTRCHEVAAGYGLDNGILRCEVVPGTLTRGGQVRASARYEAALDDLPLLGWGRVSVSSSHVEWIDPYRSRRPAGGER